jgi:zeaxanthin epoxidase
MRPDSVKNSMAIKNYVEHTDGTVDIILDDGTSIAGFDILIGADGIWSNIRAQMWNEGSVRPGSATYSGYTLFAAETIMPPDSDFFKQEGYFDAGYKVTFT